MRPQSREDSMDIQIKGKRRDRAVVARSDLREIGAYLVQEADKPPKQQPSKLTETEILIVDVEVYLSGQVWVFIPVKFEIGSSEVVFSNKDEKHHIKLEFSSSLIKEPLKIPALGTAVLKVSKGTDEENTVDLYAQPVGSEGTWNKVASGSGNGASMKINNP
jgi:hypothetical protein